MSAPNTPRGHSRRQLVARMMEFSYRRHGSTISEWSAALCERAGISHRENSTARGWKEGRNSVSAEVLMAAADVAGLSLDELQELALRDLDLEGASPLREMRDQLDRLTGQIQEMAVTMEEMAGRITTLEEVMDGPAPSNGIPIPARR